MNQKKIEEAVKTILKEVGEDIDREGLKETPKRVAKMYKEVWWGLREKEPELKFFSSSYNQMIVKTGIKVWSWCEHHLVPIEMNVSVGYIPNGRVVGISKIIRLVNWLAARPIIQEDFTEKLADMLMEKLQPQGIMVVVKGRHFCEILRGVKTDNWTITSEVRGSFKDNLSTREEFLSLVKL